jgi:hypothetical protein
MSDPIQSAVHVSFSKTQQFTQQPVNDKAGHKYQGPWAVCKQHDPAVLLASSQPQSTRLQAKEQKFWPTKSQEVAIVERSHIGQPYTQLLVLNVHVEFFV